MRKRFIPILIFFIAFSGSSVFSIGPEEAEKIVINAISKEREINDQVKVLIQLAWFDSSQPKEVSEASKQKMKEFGKSIIDVLKRDILGVSPDIQKEMIPILIHAYDHRRLRWDLDYAYTFSTLLRSPDREIKVMAMDALAYYQVPKVTLPIIDAIHEDPTLELYGIKTLGLINDPRAAKFLIDKLASPDETIAETAEEALSRMARKMPLALKKGLIDDRSSVRQSCLKLFLPIAKTDDLSFMHYIASKKEKYEPELLRQLQEAIDELEEQKAAEESAEEFSKEEKEGIVETEGEEEIQEKEEKDAAEAKERTLMSYIFCIDCFSA